MPWLRNEDAALKYKLQGLTVYDGNAPGVPVGPEIPYGQDGFGAELYGGIGGVQVGGRPVPVRYLLPQDEIANLSYPIILIKHMPVSYGADRAHSGYGQIPYAPEGYAPWWNEAATTIDPAQS